MAALAVRVIPNGLVRRRELQQSKEKRVWGRLVVVLTPAAPKFRPNGADEKLSKLVAIDDWPRTGHEILDGLEEINLDRPSQERLSLVLKPAGTGFSTKEEPEKGREIANRLWQLLMPGPQVSWRDLFLQWTCPPGDPDDLRAEALELFMPTGLAGLALPYARARQALDTIAGPQGALASRAKARPTGDRLSAVGRPWLGEPDALERFASLGTSPRDTSGLRVLGPPEPWSVLASLSKGPRVPDDDSQFFLRSISEEEIVKSALGHDGRDMLPIFDRMHALHHAGLEAIEAWDLKSNPTGSDSNLAIKRILSLMSSPTLMRLFGLARDYDVDLTPLAGDADILGQVSVDVPFGYEINAPSTACKYRARSENDPGAFCPASQAEFEGKPAESWEEQDGVRLVPRKSGNGASFGLVSIEPALGLQSDAHAFKVQRDEGTSLEEKEQIAPSLRSAGIVLFRRPPPAAVARRPAGICPPDSPVLYADDLRQFERLDIGIDETDATGKLTVSWRATTNRKVQHWIPEVLCQGEPLLKGLSKGTWIDDFVSKLLGADMRKQIHELNATYFTESALLGKTDQGVAKVNEERIAMWVGESGSIPFDAVDYPRSGKEQTGYVKEQEGRNTPLFTDSGPLPLNYVATLPRQDEPSTDPKALLPALRFGWRYRVGVRRVYLGGAGLLLEDASETYAQGTNSLPPAGETSGFPYLRHEPIGAPEIFLAPSEPKSPPAGSDAQLQGTGRAVITTWRDGPAGRGNIASTSRLMLVPRVPFEFAQLHEVFDGDKQGERTRVPGDDPDDPLASFAGRRPRDGLQRVRFRQDDTALKVDKNGKVPPATEKPPRLDLMNEREAFRPAPYYPDPLASFLVLRLKRIGSDAEWLDEEPVIVRVQQAAGTGLWPDLLPVHVELRTAANRRAGEGDTPGGPRLLSAAPILRHMTPDGELLGASRPDTIAVQSVRVSMAAGEQATLVAWLVPTVEDLAGCFDLCRTMSVLAQAEAKHQAIKRGSNDIADGLEHLIGANQCVAGSLTPVASALQLHLFKAPLPVISDVRTLDLMHAVNRPVVPPEFAVAPPREPMAAANDPDSHFPHFMPPRFARRLDAGGDKPPAFLARRRSSDDWSGDSEDGGRYLIVGGRVIIEAASTSGVILNARGAALNGDRLDNPEHEPPILEDGKPVDRKKQKEAGFAVRPDGTIEFARGEPVELVRVDGVPAPSAPLGAGRGATVLQRRVQLDFADPQAYFEDRSAAGTTTSPSSENDRALRSTSPTLRVATSQLLRDGGARWLSLSLTALSRYRNFLGIIPGSDAPGSPGTGSKDASSSVWGENGQHEVQGWIPATERPSPCFNPRLQILNPPAESSRQVTVPDGVRRSFQPIVRLYLDRPWFSSGQGELVGVVFWPPLEPDENAAGDIRTRDFLSGLAPEDLGPLGGHISTWGRNTRRSWPGPLKTQRTDKAVHSGVFLMPDAIQEAWPPILSRVSMSDGQVIKNEPARTVLMPIPGTGEKPGDEILTPVTLKTFVPRFDVQEKCWYVDLDIDLGDAPDPFVRLAVVRYQPWARPDRYGNGAHSGIRCSLPVSVGAWLRSRRTVEAKALRAQGAGGPRVEVNVKVSGPIGAVPRLKDPDEQSKGRPPRPAVRIQLWQRRGSDDVVVEDIDGQEAVWESWSKDEDSPLSLVRSADYWNATFAISPNAISSGAQYRVVIEEGEVMADVYDTADKPKPAFGLTRLISTLDVTALLSSMR